MTVSLMGAGAILTASATLFSAMKILGAVYLVWLGIQMWRTDAKPIALEAASRNKNRLTVFRQAFLVTAFNPKDIVFFVAFLPQFINPVEPALAQIVTIEITFLTMVLISNLLWIFLCGTLRDGLKNPVALKFVNRLGAGCLIGAGAFTALGRQSA